MKDTIAYIFIGEKIVAVPKAEILNDLLDIHMVEINLAFENHKGKLKDYQIKNRIIK